ncbi:hypothetical protein Lalb_Chr12g0198981 [Lupinus albus]|uniref:Uncharacterized protein n=1 Tax=Lupinus albus TaxID=3870 RepID=A0A6A4PLD1_LUPAL|nr:hypothetical protein Lalb_Chr12g0198981 [Lupinus albus]
MNSTVDADVSGGGGGVVEAPRLFAVELSFLHNNFIWQHFDLKERRMKIMNKLTKVENNE